MKKTISAMMALAMAGAMSMPALAANTAPQENSAIPAGQTAESVARLRVTIRTETGDNAQIPNPLTEHESLAALTGAVGFDVPAPSVPEGYTAELYLDIGGKVAEINYRNGEKELCYRVSRGSGDISGVYTTYSTEKTLDVKGVSVKAQGNASTELATWSTGDFTWSVYAPDGLTDAQVQQIAASVLK